MSSNNGLTAPGSSTYSSDTLHVGDGTWDSSRDTFLLPNLMGLNFATMQYNGMGNRFQDMPQYHTMILAHGVIAAVVFLGLVPGSTLLIRYCSPRNAYWAFKLHVWSQVLTVFLSTVVFVLGWFAVGPKRSLSNPHHGIGLAIYVMVLAQALCGWYVHRVERKKKRSNVPLKLLFHRWLGRTLAILGIIQIPLGLTLYGSPEALFIVFGLAAFGLLVTAFVLSYLYDLPGYFLDGDFVGRRGYMSESSYLSDGRSAPDSTAGSRLTAPFRRHPRRRNPSQVYEDPGFSDVNEKYSDEPPPRQSNWGKKILELGAAAGGAALIKKLMDRNRNKDNDYEYGRYRPARSRTASMSSDSLSRAEDGRPEPTHQPHGRPPSRPPSRSQSPYSSYFTDTGYYAEPDDNAGGRSHPFQNALAGLGIFAAARKLFGGSKKEREQARVDEMLRQDAEEERLARANSRRYTGDGTLPPRRGRASSYSDNGTTTDSSPPQGERPLASGAVDPRHRHDSTSGLPYGGGPSGHHPHHLPSDVSSPAGEYSDLTPPSPDYRRDHHRRNESPPISLKMRMHNNGRYVTLRRLPEEEAAASREARRDRRQSRHRRYGSASSASPSSRANPSDRSSDRWRRVEEMERQQEEQIQRERQRQGYGYPPAPPAAPTPSHPGMPPTPLAPQQPPPSDLPYPPPPSFASPTFTGTDGSGDYAGNRRRRRAERARARQERQHNSVEFT